MSVLQAESHSKKFELYDYLTQIDNTFDFFWEKKSIQIFFYCYLNVQILSKCKIIHIFMS